MKQITSAAELDQMFGQPGPRAANKVRRSLHPRDKEWIAHCPFVLLATADGKGRCDVSPKGDPAGFVTILDDRTIAIPDRPGNRRVDGLRNIVDNPQVGVLFVIPGRTDTLRVNGRARLLVDVPYAAGMAVKGHTPALVLEVAVDEVFYHCAKAFLRADLWKPDAWRPDAVASRAQIVKDTEAIGETLAELEAYYGPAYGTKLYGQ